MQRGNNNVDTSNEAKNIIFILENLCSKQLGWDKLSSRDKDRIVEIIQHDINLIQIFMNAIEMPSFKAALQLHEEGLLKYEILHNIRVSDYRYQYTNTNISISDSYISVVRQRNNNKIESHNRSIFAIIEDKVHTITTKRRDELSSHEPMISAKLKVMIFLREILNSTLLIDLFLVGNEAFLDSTIALFKANRLKPGYYTLYKAMNSHPGIITLDLLLNRSELDLALMAKLLNEIGGVYSFLTNMEPSDIVKLDTRQLIMINHPSIHTYIMFRPNLLEEIQALTQEEFSSLFSGKFDEKIHQPGMTISEIVGSAKLPAKMNTTESKSIERVRVEAHPAELGPIVASKKMQAYPKSYYNLTKDTDVEFTKATRLLRDYIKDGSAVKRFFCFSWNHHHIIPVQVIINLVDNNTICTTVDLLAHLELIKPLNPKGSLARRIEFIRENCLQDNDNKYNSRNVLRG